ncbi:hypothetical protein DL95DRAFT_115713 [Leptodontidium sp. 2 PMI_412]|nr:hypothetical protein DL95DRAFT_115713 [Leptodontidium sp. 2 PMI_412]
MTSTRTTTVLAGPLTTTFTPAAHCTGSLVAHVLSSNTRLLFLGDSGADCDPTSFAFDSQPVFTYSYYSPGICFSGTQGESLKESRGRTQQV